MLVIQLTREMVNTRPYKDIGGSSIRIESGGVWGDNNYNYNLTKKMTS